jgi:hypothetical protein
MVLSNLTSVFIESLLSSYFQGSTTEGILLIIFLTAIFFLIVIVKHKRKSKSQSVLICHNKKLTAETQTTEQWEKAKVHIEKLLYKMTEQRQSSDFLEQQLSNSDEHLNCEVIKHRQAECISTEGCKQEESSRQSSQPLNVHELKAVATLAKRLHTRNQH